MKILQNFIRLLCLTLLSVSFSQCASSIKLQKKPPTKFVETYFQEWVSGVKGGGSGLNVFIEVKDDNLVLDSIYFRGKISGVETKPLNPNLFIGRFKGEANSQESLSDLDNENVKASDFPFKLKLDECVVSYKDGNQLKYYKITDLKEKPVDALPMSSPPNTN